jgi:Ca-activated chloride channel family protein
MERHFIRRRLAIASLAILLVIPLAFTDQGPAGTTGQSGQQQPPSRISNQTYRVSVDLVNIFCSVWDKKTKSFLTNLTQEDFVIYEDGEPQQIKNFVRETDLPLTIGLLVDTSQSVAPKLKFEQEAATNFFYSVLRRRDRAMLIEFDSGVTMLQDFTNDPNKLAKQIKKLRAAGGTALYDAITLTCDEKLIREIGRKTIVILSDGEDQSSTSTFDEALQMAIRAEATIFPISVNRGGFFGVGGSREGDKIMKDFAEQTGGRAFFPFKVDELEEAFRQISQELRSQYNLGYVSRNTDRDGGYRKIEVKVAEKDIDITYRKGYFAPGT